MILQNNNRFKDMNYSNKTEYKMSSTSVILLDQNKTTTKNVDEAVYYKGNNKRALKIKNKKGELSTGFKNLLRERRVPVPDGYSIGKTGRISKTQPRDVIVIRKLDLKTAKKYGFKTKKGLLEFLAYKSRMNRPILRFSQLEKVYNKHFKATQKIRKKLDIVVQRNVGLQNILKTLKVIKRKENKNLRIKSTTTFIKFGDVTGTSIPDIRVIISYIIRETILRETLKNNDKIQLRFESKDLHKGAVSTSYVLVKHSDALVDMALEKLKNILQSDKSLKDVNITINSIDMPQGNGRTSKVISVKERLLKKRGVFPIQTQSHCGFISCALTKPIAKRMNASDRLWRKDPIRDKARFKAGLEVMTRCGIPHETETCDFDDFTNIASTFGVCIHIWDAESKTWIHTPNITEVPNDDHSHSYIVKTGNHFDPIHEPKNWFEKSYICHTCEVGFDKSHTCKKEDGDVVLKKHEKKDTHCHFCKKEKDDTCYHRCCPNCLKDISKKGYKHKCYMNCGKVVATKEQKEIENASLLRVEDDGRHIYEVKNLRVSDKYIFFDVEAMTMTDDSHVINLVVAHYIDGTQFVFKTLDEFMGWLLAKTKDEKGKEKFIHDGFTIMAHYGSGYDFKFIYEWIFKNTDDVHPFTIFNGSKITYMSLNKKIKLRFVDSFRFFLCSLEKLPKMFGLKELKKGYFPHMFNRPENQNYIGKYPDKSFYCHDDMKDYNLDTKEDKYKDFMVWHDTKSNETFDFQKELLEYCISDVDILRRACIELRKFFMETEGLDPFQYTTLPATTLALFRANHMPKKSMAVFDHGCDNQSNIALEWLAYREVIDKHKIHTVRDGREAWIHVERDGVIKSKKVDGLYKKEVYEFSGCFHHGCPKCFPTLKQKYDRTKRHNQEVENAGYKLHHIWECEWRQMRKQDDVQCVLDAISQYLPINPREAFFGGRTDALKTYFDCGKAPMKCKIFYKDVTSLYPWVNYTCEYPVGHPEIIRSNFDYSLKSYFGIVKCKVQPPNNLYHPVLPRKINGKLVFDLGGKDNKTFVGTWTTMELTKAVQMGYVIKKVFEVHHFKERSSSIFKTYVERFLKIKQEASGYPSWVKTEADKDEYVRTYYEQQGILLDKDKIKKNDGLRSFAKLCLNNLWGRFGMRSFNDSRRIIRNYNDVLSVLTDKDVVQDTLNFHLFDDIDHAIATYETPNGDRDSMYTTNIYIAIFTTSWARLKLYSALEVLGERVLYMDTDSVVYYHEDDENHGLNEGDLLGEWTDEMKDHWGETWVSGGPKNYGYKIAKKDGCKDDCKVCGSAVCKVKGFSLTHKNSKSINTDTLIYAVRKACIDDSSSDQSSAMEAHNFRIRYDAKTRKMVSMTEKKDWSYQVDKREQRCVKDYMIDTIPHGFLDNKLTI